MSPQLLSGYWMIGIHDLSKTKLINKAKGGRLSQALSFENL